MNIRKPRVVVGTLLVILSALLCWAAVEVDATIILISGVCALIPLSILVVEHQSGNSSYRMDGDKYLFVKVVSFFNSVLLALAWASHALVPAIQTNV